MFDDYKDLFKSSSTSVKNADNDVTISRINQFFKDFNILARVTSHKNGPIVSRYGITLGKGVKIKTISNMLADMELAIRAREHSVRLTTISESGEVAIEVPNAMRGDVDALSVLSVTKCDENGLNIGIGVNVVGEPKTFSLTKAPHVLLAGSTGSGKSVCINTMICNLIMHNDPTNLRLILIDPKGTDMGIYNTIPHLLHNVVRNPEDAIKALDWCVEEMERRYTLMTEIGARDLASFNKKVKSSKKIFNLLTMPNVNYNGATLPYIVVVIDEFADLMACSKDTMELAVKRMAAKARAAGIHLILATQRPSVDVVSGVLKSNLPTRIALKLAQTTDSMTIIGSKGAETLVGNGDMIIKCDSFEDRMHGFYISNETIEKIVERAEDKYSSCNYRRMVEWSNQFNPNDLSFSDMVAQAKLKSLPTAKAIADAFNVGTSMAWQIFYAMNKP